MGQHRSGVGRDLGGEASERYSRPRCGVHAPRRRKSAYGARAAYSGPLLGEQIEPDVVSRWLAPSPDDDRIEAALVKWRRHREMPHALARKDWAARAADIDTSLAKARSGDATEKTPLISNEEPRGTERKQAGKYRAVRARPVSRKSGFASP